MLVYPTTRQELERLGLFDQFCSLLERQFEHGGEKYALDARSEFTDLLTSIDPQFVAVTIAKYAGRYPVYFAERDLLKIATYAFIYWIKLGEHIDDLDQRPDDPTICTTVEIKRKLWPMFRQRLQHFISMNDSCERQGYAPRDWVRTFDPKRPFAEILLLCYSNEMAQYELLYIASEAFYVWIQDGHHLRAHHDEDVASSAAKTEVEHLPRDPFPGQRFADTVAKQPRDRSDQKLVIFPDMREVDKILEEARLDEEAHSVPADGSIEGEP